MDIFEAARHGELQLVNTYLERGDNVDLQMPHTKDTALIIAARNGHTEIVKLLLSHDNHLVNVRNSLGQTALIWAALCGHTEIVKLLLNQGDQVDLQDINDRNALMLASSNGHTEIVNKLLTHGAQVDLRNYQQNTALMLAIQNDHTEIVNMIHTALCADAFLSNAKIPAFLPEHIELFFARASHAISKNLDITQYSRLVAYCTDHNLELPEELAQKIADSFATLLFDNLMQSNPVDTVDLNKLDNSMIKRIFEAFKTKAQEEGVNDYDTMIVSLNPALLPEFLVDSITKLMQGAKESLDDFESIVRGEIEGISIVPARLVKEGIDSNDEYYQTNENTTSYYTKYPEEQNHPGSYFTRMGSEGLIQAMNNLVAEVIYNILFTLSNSKSSILPSHVKEMVQHIRVHYTDYETTEEMIDLPGDDDMPPPLEHQNDSGDWVVEMTGEIEDTQG